MRYITRESAVWEGRAGLSMVHLPGEVTRYRSYDALRASLIAWAEQNAAKEHRSLRHSVRSPRTHYRAVLGFDCVVSTAVALGLVDTWLRAVLPRVRAIASLHRDTVYPHVHVWIEARQTDGRKVNLSAREFRQLDEVWNRLYCRALGRNEREHLAKKWATERAKALRREGRPVVLPERTGYQKPYRRQKWGRKWTNVGNHRTAIRQLSSG